MNYKLPEKAQTDGEDFSLERIPCTALSGVGAKLAGTLGKRGIHSMQDLLFHLPFRYQDRTRLSAIRDLQVGDLAIVEGIIQKVKTFWGAKPTLLCEISDGSAHLVLRFFHFNAAQTSHLIVGERLRCFGEVRLSSSGLTMIHPEYRQVKVGEALPVDESLTPVYPLTDGLSQQVLRRLTEQALNYLEKSDGLKELLPPSVRERFHFVHLREAIHYVHRPPPDAAQGLLMTGLHPMQQRLAFEELVAHNLSLRRLRQRVQSLTAPCFPPALHLEEPFLGALPFNLTLAQQRVIAEIKADIAKPHPMLRLVQGDVGSGKTVVAAVAALQAVAAGYQAVLMAPTELLAEQHYRNFCQWFEPLGIQVAWLAGKLKANPRREALASIATGTALVVVGTHALFQKEVHFAKLGLVIVDEQHRFGVHQRMALRQKAEEDDRQLPHQLIMTATPIPRTLAMTAYADLDYSVIDELPPGRIPVNTIALPNTRRGEILQRVFDVCQAKSQVYWVCTLIEESEILQCQAAEDTLADLCVQLPQLRIGLVHGRMSTDEKETMMAAFKAGEVDLLVATTVVEVGVDVPNASLMIIENPERLGLAQLHQLRGRVGRGAASSHCVLLYQAPLTTSARARLAILRETHDGFEIARRDLELRGPGEVLGTRQTGELQFKIADVVRDQGLLNTVQEVASLLLNEHPREVESLIKRWVGQGEQYGEV